MTNNQELPIPLDETDNGDTVDWVLPEEQIDPTPRPDVFSRRTPQGWLVDFPDPTYPEPGPGQVNTVIVKDMPAPFPVLQNLFRRRKNNQG